VVTRRLESRLWCEVHRSTTQDYCRRLPATSLNPSSDSQGDVEVVVEAAPGFQVALREARRDFRKRVEAAAFQAQEAEGGQTCHRLHAPAAEADTTSMHNLFRVWHGHQIPRFL